MPLEERHQNPSVTGFSAQLQAGRQALLCCCLKRGTLAVCILHVTQREGFDFAGPVLLHHGKASQQSHWGQLSSADSSLLLTHAASPLLKEPKLQREAPLK